MPKLHPLVRIELDGMRPVTRTNWLWRPKQDWAPGHVARRGKLKGKRLAGKYMRLGSVTAQRARDAQEARIRLAVIRQQPKAARESRSRTAAAQDKRDTRTVAGTYSQHVHLCPTCSSGGPCDYARNKFGAVR